MGSDSVNHHTNYNPSTIPQIIIVAGRRWGGGGGGVTVIAVVAHSNAARKHAIKLISLLDLQQQVRYILFPDLDVAC